MHGADSSSAILLRLRMGGAIPPFPYVFNGMVLKKTQGVSDFMFIFIDCLLNVFEHVLKIVSLFYVWW